MPTAGIGRRTLTECREVVSAAMVATGLRTSALWASVIGPAAAQARIGGGTFALAAAAATAATKATTTLATLALAGSFALNSEGLSGRATSSQLGAHLSHIIGVMLDEGRMGGAANQLSDVGVCDRQRVVKHGLECRSIRWCDSGALDRGDGRHHVIILQAQIILAQLIPPVDVFGL